MPVRRLGSSTGIGLTVMAFGLMMGHGTQSIEAIRLLQQHPCVVDLIDNGGQHDFRKKISVVNVVSFIKRNIQSGSPGQRNIREP